MSKVRTLLTAAQLCNTAAAATLAAEADEGFKGSEQVHPLADQGKALPQVFIPGAGVSEERRWEVIF
jgi:hypothetical protein